MKKLFAFLLALAMLMSLCACGKRKSEPVEEPLISDTNKITGIQYCDGSVTLRFAQDENAVWYWMDGTDFPLDSTFLNQLVLDIAEVLKLKSSGSNTEPTACGLDTENKYLNIQTADGEVKMIFGNQMADGRWYMCYAEDSSALYAVDDAFLKKLSVSIFDMAVIPSLPELTEENMRSITLTIPSGEFIKLENKDGKWNTIGKKYAGLDETAAALTKLEILRCVDFQPSSGALPLCGLDSPLKITIQYTNTVNTDSELVLYVGAVDSEQTGYLAMIGESSTIYLFNREALEALVTLSEKLAPVQSTAESAE